MRNSDLARNLKSHLLEQRELGVEELDAVSGGTPAKAAPKAKNDRPTESVSLTFTQVALSY
jgi:hypothetical protein